MQSLDYQGMVLLLGKTRNGNTGHEARPPYTDGEGSPMGTIFQGAHKIFLFNIGSSQGQGYTDREGCLTKAKHHAGFTSDPFIIIRGGTRQGCVKKNLAGTPNINGYRG